MADGSPHVGDVRGLGAMMGMELSWDRDPAGPAGELAHAVAQKCLERGVLVLGAGVDGNVIRALPPLVISDAELDFAFDAMRDALAEATTEVHA